MTNIEQPRGCRDRKASLIGGELGDGRLSTAPSWPVPRVFQSRWHYPWAWRWLDASGGRGREAACDEAAEPFVESGAHRRGGP
jgi:hypothetical protein